jgi:hypothetical protein
MNIVFWIFIAACYLLGVFLAVSNLGACVLDRRAGRKLNYAAVVRATLWLVALFGLPRVLPYPELRFGVLAGLLIWEAVVWVRRRNGSEQPVTLSAAK